jgi:hypothetical protein
MACTQFVGGFDIDACCPNHCQVCERPRDEHGTAPERKPCACVSEDARRCLRLRHPYPADLEDEDDDSVDEWCECICHECSADNQ